MTAEDFRKIVLSLPDTDERSHMDHPDFRVAGKVFATLGYPNKNSGMVKLSPEDQHNFSKDYPDAFVPVKGAWGRRGATSVHLKAAKKEVARKSIEAAWRNVAPKRLLRQHGRSARTSYEKVLTTEDTEVHPKYRTQKLTPKCSPP